MDTWRLKDGGCVDRTRPLRFTFDGVRYSGFAGDTLASALLANGVHLVGRSFKYHRPRGIVSAGAEEPNALVTLDPGGGRATPNLRATQVELYAGLNACSQNRWPSLAHDLGSVIERFSPLIAAGFYYKTFMWPRSFWAKVYEPAIRATVGLGQAPPAPDLDRYLHRYAHCDVLVVGSGPSGLAAARAAAKCGARVILCDEQSEFGGSLLAEPGARIDGATSHRWIADTVAGLAETNGMRLLPRTTAFSYSVDNLIGLAERVSDHLPDPDCRLPRERLWLVRAKEVVLAAGAIERPLVFGDNDRPGVMLAEAARTYVNRYGVLPGRRAVVVTTDDSAYRAAIDLRRAGIAVAAVCDLRADPGDAADAVRDAAIPVFAAANVSEVRGKRRVEGVTVTGKNGISRRFECDLLLVCGGWTPAVHLFSQSRGLLRYADRIDAFVPDVSVQRERSAGACRGTYGLEACLAEGEAAGREAARAAGCPAAPARAYTVEGAPPPRQEQGGGLPVPKAGGRSKAFVDFQNDVTTNDIALAIREGFRSVEHLKRYTTTGMGTDQGKTSNMTALAMLGEATGQPIPSVGHTTFRQPYTPVTLGTFAGAARGNVFDPIRKAPLHDWAETNGAVFEDVGMWKRARYFPRLGEDMHAAVARECAAVRQSVGIFDASTLGKIEVVGPDAAQFLNLMYTNSLLKLQDGRCRYGLMLGEDGFVSDDGIVARLAEDRFHITTTTGGAPSVLNRMEDYLQTEFPALQVWLTSITEQWAVIALQGPRAREVLTPLVEDIDLGSEAMPHMSVRQGRICGVPTRLFRVSFTGETGFEVNVTPGYARDVWEAIWRRGQRFAVAPYGTETMHVLRAEKGYIIVGQETDGTVTPEDLGMGWVIGRNKADFVGKRSLTLADRVRPGRLQLVGLLGGSKTPLEEGTPLVAEAGRPRPRSSIGHVTSSYWSETLQRPIALALLADGRDRIGSRVAAVVRDAAVPIDVVAPVFFDPEGNRLNG